MALAAHLISARIGHRFFATGAAAAGVPWQILPFTAGKTVDSGRPLRECADGQRALAAHRQSAIAAFLLQFCHQSPQKRYWY
jgi:hypothetical protein